MTDLVHGFALYFISSLWLVPLLTALGWSASRALKRLGPEAEHKVWVATLVCCVSIPALPYGKSLLSLSGLATFQSGSASSLRMSAPAVQLLRAKPFVLTNAAMLALAAMYLIVVSVFTTRMCLSLLKTLRVLRQSTPSLVSDEIAELWSECRRTFCLSETRLLYSATLSGPATVALISPVLLLPLSFCDEVRMEDLRVAFAHECAHLRRQDFQKNLLYEAIGLLVAFHPATRLVRARIAQTREMICDRMAVETLIEPRLYVRSLLRLATIIGSPAQVTTPHAIGILDANILEKRIMTIRSGKQALSKGTRYGLATAAGLFFVLAATASAAVAVRFTPDIVKTPVYEVGKEATAPILIKAPNPDYPAAARNKPGTDKVVCVVGMIVDESGIPRDVHIMNSTNKDFDKDALAAVQQYRFQPALHEGKPVPVSLRVEVNFQKF